MQIDHGSEVEPADSQRILALVAAYFAQVDQSGSKAVSGLFAPQGSLTLGSVQLRGRRAIGEFFEKREAGNLQSRRIVRHLTNPPDLSRRAAGHISGHSTAVVFAAVGDLPLASAPPSTICDFDDIYVRLGNRWFFESRKATVLFIGANAATFARQPSE